MRKHQIILCLTISLFVGLSGCTSKKVENESTDAAAITGDSETESSDGGEETAELSDDFGGDEGGDAGVAEETKTADAPAESESEMDAVAEDDSGDEAADEDSGDEVADEDSGEDGESVDALETAQTEKVEPAEPAPPVADSGSSLKDDEMSGLSAAPSEETPVAKPVIPLKKMLTTPYTKDGTLVNAIYIARQGDTLEGVSQKIYGQDKVAELKKINGNLANRDLKVGDKVYYNSPQRPNDSSQLLVYYEDIGLTAEIHEVAKEGENIRTVSKELLGDENSWKEIWATNPDVESKDVLELGTRLRYWSNGVAASAAPVVAATTPAEPPPTAPVEPPVTNEPPPMPDEVAQAQDPNAAAATMAEPPPPPPTDVAMNEPPPPPPPVEAAPPAQETPATDEPTDDTSAAAANDQMVWFGLGGAVLLAMVAILIIARKRRAKKGIDFQTATHTQIE